MTMKGNAIVISRDTSNSDGPVEYHVLGLDDWDFFDSLISFFQKNYQAEITNKNDGVYTRTWQLRSSGEYFMLEHHDDIGNWFYTCNEEGDSELMHRISADLEERLKNVPSES